MAVFKCKMCGGNLDIEQGVTVYECEYCGTRQTVPSADDDKKLTLFTRANRLRFNCEFDKAAGVYESIVADFPEDAEAYWGLVLCKYGIEYVDDPTTAKKIPTCHRSSFESVMDDSNYEMALEYADAVARPIYREEAKVIEEIRKGIIEVSSKEEPYDIFICYKETDENGDRTIDSVIAQDVYAELTEKGYRVFFSRITLEDKLGIEYEPYIFAALNSSKIMLAFGTDYEYYNAVWVKNEWSRYLQLISSGEKKTLIPCYKGIDAYDMPKEFARLQAQDMGKVGAIQDLIRGIEKIIPKKISVNMAVDQPMATNPTVDTYLKRVSLFLEDGDWNNADEYCEKILDLDPQNADAYIGKVLSKNKLFSLELICECDTNVCNDKNFDKAIRFSDGAKREKLLKIKDFCDKKEYIKQFVLCLKKHKKASEEKEIELTKIMQLQEEEKRLQLEKEAEEKRIEELGYGRLTLIVKNSFNPFALANGCKFVFTINGHQKITLVADSGDVSETIRLSSGINSVKLEVYGWNDNLMIKPIQLVKETKFNIVKDKDLYLSVNRSTLIKDCKFTFTV